MFSLEYKGRLFRCVWDSLEKVVRRMGLLTYCWYMWNVSFNLTDSLF